jgi:hypothetical protein
VLKVGDNGAALGHNLAASGAAEFDRCYAGRFNIGFVLRTSTRY